MHSFEFHEERYNAVKYALFRSSLSLANSSMLFRTEFTHHGLDQISLQHRNVCKDGFPESLHASVDAVFLDLPAPWEAVEFAKKVLKVSAWCSTNTSFLPEFRSHTARSAHSNLLFLTLYRASDTNSHFPWRSWFLRYLNCTFFTLRLTHWISGRNNHVRSPYTPI